MKQKEAEKARLGRDIARIDLAGKKPPSVKPLSDLLAERYREFLASGPKDKVFVVAIGGAEATAKTFLAGALADGLAGKASVRTLALDDYFKMTRKERAEKVAELRERGGTGDEDLMILEIGNEPYLVDFGMILGHIGELKRGNAVVKNFYDHLTGEIVRDKEEVQPITQGILIVEGVYALRGELRQATDLGVFVFTEEEKRHERVYKRDAAERSHGAYESNKYFFGAQLPSYRRYIEPTIKNADVVVDTTRLFG